MGVTAFGVYTVAVAGATWAIRADVLADREKQIESYEKAESWKAPEVIKKLDSISLKLHEQMLEKEAVDKLKVENLELENGTKNLNAQLSVSAQELDKAKASIILQKKTIENLMAKGVEFTLRPGQSRDLVPNQLSLGYISSSKITGDVRVNVNNERVTLDVGQRLAFNNLSLKCSLLLAEIGENQASFKFVCQPSS